MKKKKATMDDVCMEYVKFVIYMLSAYAFFHFVIMGWAW